MAQIFLSVIQVLKNGIFHISLFILPIKYLLQTQRKMKKYVIACLWTIFFGLNSYVYSGDVEVILKDNTENSGFTVKEESTGDTIARFT